MESWSFEPPASQAQQNACTPRASTSTERRSRPPPHATTNRIIHALIEKIVSVPFGESEQYYNNAWSLHQESVKAKIAYRKPSRNFSSSVLSSPCSLTLFLVSLLKHS